MVFSLEPFKTAIKNESLIAGRHSWYVFPRRVQDSVGHAAFIISRLDTLGNALYCHALFNDLAPADTCNTATMLQPLSLDGWHDLTALEGYLLDRTEGILPAAVVGIKGGTSRTVICYIVRCVILPHRSSTHDCQVRTKQKVTLVILIGLRKLVYVVQRRADCLSFITDMI